jgi:signal transduction histidine kinase
MGTGLGLAVVKTIVDDHGGTIAVSSAQGHGTTVRVHLPTSGRARMRGFVA